MRLLKFVLAFSLCSGTLSGAEVSPSVPPAPITSLRAIHALSNAEAGRQFPVAFIATVTYYKKGNVDLFVQDGDVAIYIETAKYNDIAIGDRVLVQGTTRASFRPEVKGDSVVILNHGDPPRARPATFRQLIRAELDCQRVIVHAKVRSVNSVLDGGLKSIYLQLLMDGGSIDAEVLERDPGDLAELLDAEIEITGAVAGRFDSKMQLTGILLEVNSLSDLKIVKRPRALPGALPLTPIDEILKDYDVLDKSRRVRVQGVITYYQAGSAMVLQDGAKSLWVTTQYEQPLRIGQRVSVTGFSDVRNGSLTLTGAEVEADGPVAPVTPVPSTSSDLASGEMAFDLVSVSGRLLMAIREAAQDEYVVVADGHLFSAVYRHPERGMEVALPPMTEVALGSTVRMTGILVLDNGYRFQGPAAFEILLRSSDDIAVVGKPSPLNVRNLTLIVGLLVLILMTIGVRALLTERRIRLQTAESAALEQRRSQILESMNGGRPLPEILSLIIDLLSARLNGAPSWCILADGLTVGNSPSNVTARRVIQREILSRSGASMGTLSVALNIIAKPDDDEAGALSVALELATLAIEGRRLHSDLVHRSEFDLLTDIHNRFSMEKRIDVLIKEGNANGSKFGLIYIDLDGFKHINDFYGHRFGDLYLQTVAMRMNRQIRPIDLLARLGGDEFAVLVDSAGNQEFLREIAIRIEHGFDEPFLIEDIPIRGSASVGFALFPVDGLTKDDLLNAADVRMYRSKRAKVSAQSASDRLEVSRLSRRGDDES